jgi:HlyD family secretion protein
MSVDVDIVVTESADALHVPAQAIVRSNGQPYVYRLAGSHAKRTAVKLGLETVNEVEVVEGLSAEDHVVVGPLRDLQDGDRVEARLRHVGTE